MAQLRLRPEKEEAASKPSPKVHPIDLGVLLFLVVGFPVSLVFLPSPVSLVLLLAVVVGWIAWKRTQ